MPHFLEALDAGRVLLMDGAMGTELQKRGLEEGESSETWNLTHPDQVRAVHQAYVDAGADGLLTNTFQVVPAAIAMSSSIPSRPFRYDAWRALTTLEWTAYVLARSACGDERFVCADVGAYSDPSTGKEFWNLALLRLASAVWSLADVLLLETCSTPRARQAVATAQGVLPGRCILLSMTYLRNDAGELVTFSGHSPEWFAERSEQWGVAALGVNCGRDIDMDDIIAIVRRYRTVTDLPLFARPNAGTPRREGKKWVYPHTPKMMAERLPELLETGISMVGGCCGTTPEHIAAFRRVIDKWNARR